MSWNVLERYFQAKVASLLNDIVNISLVDALKPEPIYEGQLDQHAAVCLRYHKDVRGDEYDVIMISYVCN